MHQLSPMAFERTISFWLNAVACLAFAAALVLFPPSASHAASGMHDGHYAAVMDDVADINAQDALHDHSTMDRAAVYNHSDKSPSSAPDDSAGNCCNGMCLSIVLMDHAHPQDDAVTAGTYKIGHAQARSLEAQGFLRPPQS